MQESLTLNGKFWPRTLSFLSGVGMVVASILTIRHYFLANFPESIFEGSFCDISAFFNCDSSAYSVISQVWGVPLGYPGLFVGALVALGALFPSAAFERTNRSLSLLNAAGVIALLLFSVFFLGSLCLLCAGYYVFSLISFYLFWRYAGGSGLERLAKFLSFSVKHAVVFAVVLASGAYGFSLFHGAKVQAQSGSVASQVVKQYFSLPRVESPSIVSPFWTVKSTERFEDAPIQLIEYADFLCSDCRFFNEQLARLKEEFKGKINVSFQFFPLDAQCNDVVDKNKHPGACELSYLSAYDPARFVEIHDEIFANMTAAKKPEWRAELARKHGVEAALNDMAVKDLVHAIIRTGTEYEKTSEKFAHGIRSTPTMILNNRMIIGTLPYAHLKAIFQALVDQQDKGETRFIENWEKTKP